MLEWCEMVLAEGYAVDQDTADMAARAQDLHAMGRHALAKALAVGAIERAMALRCLPAGVR